VTPSAPRPVSGLDPPCTVAPRRCRGDSGSASTELVILMPLLLLLVLVSVHVALWFHARHLVNAAAQEGARAARAAGATDADGYDRAQQILGDLGSNSVTSPAITVTRSGGAVSVSVTGQAPPVIPGLATTVSATSTSPIEEFKP
jgi:Flp pilus assembly protein TadG